MPKIKELFAFVAEDSGPEDEGIIGMSLGGDLMMPLVGADMARVESLKPAARQIAWLTGKKVKLLRFSTREDLGVIE